MKPFKEIFFLVEGYRVSRGLSTPPGRVVVECFSVPRNSRDAKANNEKKTKGKKSQKRRKEKEEEEEEKEEKEEAKKEKEE